MNLFEKYYDKEYKKERDKFVPPAEKYANNLCGASIKTRNEEERSAWNSKWNLTFHKKMNQLSMCLFKDKKGKESETNTVVREVL
uniref:Uncharacterized protein n=1 Tax=viral metagenome TaxID=1070528 RepID=A0A6M3IM97_9ZZZZ